MALRTTFRIDRSSLPAWRKNLAKARLNRLAGGQVTVTVLLPTGKGHRSDRLEEHHFATISYDGWGAPREMVILRVDRSPLSSTIAHAANAPGRLGIIQWDHENNCWVIAMDTKPMKFKGRQGVQSAILEDGLARVEVAGVILMIRTQYFCTSK